MWVYLVYMLLNKKEPATLSSLLSLLRQCFHTVSHRNSSSDEGPDQYRSKRSRSNRPCLVVYNQASSPSAGEEDDDDVPPPPQQLHQQHQRHISLATVPVASHVVHAAGSLSGGGTGSHVSTSDGIHYQISKGDNGPVAYRVVPVHDLSPSTGQHSSSSDADRSPEHNGSQHRHQTHPPSSSSLSGHHSNLMAQQLALTSGSAQALLAAGGSGSSFHVTGGGGIPVSAGRDGPFFVMMTPTSSLTSEPARKKSVNSFSPTDLSMTSNIRMTSGVNPRDDKRRATHNEVERRRRDKINNWIMRLAKLVPDCDHDHSKSGQVCLSLSLSFVDVFSNIH